MFTSVGPIKCPASFLDWTFDVPGIGVNENTRGLVCPSFEELFELCLGCRSDEENETSVNCKSLFSEALKDILSISDRTVTMREAFEML